VLIITVTKEEVRIRSSRHAEFSTNVRVGKDEYNVVTEDAGGKEITLFTRTYLRGEIVSTRKTKHGDRAGMVQRRLRVLMRDQHQMAVNALGAEEPGKDRSPADYLDEMKKGLRKRDHAGALEVLRGALGQYPEDPFILSYFGCLTSILERNHEEGIKACKKAVKHLQHSMPFGQEFFYPTLYLNLGRACVAADRKRDAVLAFKKGLRADGENGEIAQELSKLGLRRQPVAPFLARSNPLNKYMGLFLHRLNRGMAFSA
jgi:tetratricopeptide (TPR) repeat protein